MFLTIRPVTLSGVGASGGSLLDALQDTLTGQTAVKTQNAVNVDASATASGTIIAVAVLGVVAVYLATSRKPRRRRSKRRQS